MTHEEDAARRTFADDERKRSVGDERLAERASADEGCGCRRLRASFVHLDRRAVLHPCYRQLTAGADAPEVCRLEEVEHAHLLQRLTQVNVTRQREPRQVDVREHVLERGDSRVQCRQGHLLLHDAQTIDSPRQEDVHGRVSLVGQFDDVTTELFRYAVAEHRSFDHHIHLHRVAFGQVERVRHRLSAVERYLPAALEVDGTGQNQVRVAVDVMPVQHVAYHSAGFARNPPVDVPHAPFRATAEPQRLHRRPVVPHSDPLVRISYPYPPVGENAVSDVQLVVRRRVSLFPQEVSERPVHEPRTHPRISENLTQFRVRFSAGASVGHGHCCRYAVG